LYTLASTTRIPCDLVSIQIFRHLLLIPLQPGPNCHVRCWKDGAKVRGIRGSTEVLLDGLEIICLDTTQLPAPGSRSAFHRSFQLACHPPTIKVAYHTNLRSAVVYSESVCEDRLPTFLWCHLLVVHETLPRHPVGIKRDIALDIFERRGGGFVAPDLVLHAVASRLVLQIPIRRTTLPLTQRCFIRHLGELKRIGDGLPGKIIC
jgi:hypothetical protein